MNEEVLKLAVKGIEVERAPNKGWNQELYAVGRVKRTEQGRFLDMEACGSAMCLAGQVVHQAGWLLVADPGDAGVAASSCAFNPETGETGTIHNVARQLLGVNIKMAHDLFISSAHISDVNEFKRYVTAKTGVEFD